MDFLKSCPGIEFPSNETTEKLTGQFVARQRRAIQVNSC